MANRKRDTLVFYKFMTIATFILVVFALAFYFVPAPNVVPQPVAINELSTEGYMNVDVIVNPDQNPTLITLETQCYQLTANTEPSQVQSIANGLSGNIGPRPNTHDLMRDALDSLDVQVVMVKIVDIQNNTFIGQLILKQGNKIVSLDSRPSDDIAIAVRTSAPIYIRTDLFQAQAKYVC